MLPAMTAPGNPHLPGSPESSTVRPPSGAGPTHIADRLCEAIRRFGSPACVGLDPVLDRLPAAVRARHHDPVRAIHEFCMGVIDVVADVVPVLKPQSACFERYGEAGVAALRLLTRHAAARGMVVILDAKRGDIGVTAEHYAAAAFGGGEAGRGDSGTGSHWLTVNGYMGPDTIEPFLGSATHGVFVLVRTSNPGSDVIQARKVGGGPSASELVADMVAELGRADGRRGLCGLSSVGAVVGATKSSEAEGLRTRMPDQFFLVPGYGAQGGTLDDIRPCLRDDRDAGSAGVVVNASRSVIYAFKPDDEEWQGSVRAAGQRLVDELGSLFR